MLVRYHNIVLAAFLVSVAVGAALVVISLKREDGSSIPTLLFAGISACWSVTAADRSDCAWAERVFSIVPAVALLLAFSSCCLWRHHTLRRFNNIMCLVLWCSYFVSWPLFAICFTLNVPGGNPSALKLLLSNLLFSGPELFVLAMSATVSVSAYSLLSTYLTRLLPSPLARFFARREAETPSDRDASQSRFGRATLVASVIVFVLFLFSVVPSRFSVGRNLVYSAATVTAAIVGLVHGLRDRRRRRAPGCN